MRKNETFHGVTMYIELTGNIACKKYGRRIDIEQINDTNFNECEFINVTFREMDFNKIQITNSKFRNCSFVDCINPIGFEINTLEKCCVYGEKEIEKQWHSIIPMACPREGEFIAYKKLARRRIATLRIPADARRSSAYGKKCRADKAEVIKIESLTKPEMKCRTGYGYHYRNFRYEVGKMVYPEHGFDENRFEECAAGIHFFMNKIDAIEYDG